MKLIKYFLCILFLLPTCLFAQMEPIPVTKAFQFQVLSTHTDSLLLQWQIEPGYYLYKDRFHFKILSSKDAVLGKIIMPNGISKTDNILGTYSVYDKNLSISIPLLNSSHEPVKLLVNYQGCASWGFCYPPQAKLVTIAATTQLTAQDISITDYIIPTPFTSAKKIASVPLSEQAKANAILQSDNSFGALVLFFGLGLLLAFTPCVLPMVPILSGIIIGHGQHLSSKKALALSTAYVLGMALSFALAGVFVGMAGSSVQAAMQTPWVIMVFSAVFVLLALSLFGFYELQLPSTWQQKINHLSQKQKTGHYLGVFIMGGLSTLIVSPCVSAPLVGALAYIGKTGNAVFGGFALFFMALGMGFPLLIIGTSFGKLIPKAGHWMNTVKSVFGVMMLGVAIWMLQRIMPASLTLFLWACLAIISSIYMGALRTTPEHGWGKFWQGIGIVLLTYGILLVVGAAQGNSSLFNPLKNFYLAASGETATVSQSHFIRIKSLQDLQQQLNNSTKPVMLDFYAHWCASCQEMERTTFANKNVMNALDNFTVLQADVTQNDVTDKILMRHFGVVAPPTILFFTKGKELPHTRIIGEMNAKNFLQHLRSLSLSPASL